MKNTESVLYDEQTVFNARIAKDWGRRFCAGANFKKWRLYCFPVVVLFCKILTILSSFSNSDVAENMSVKVKDVLDALQQMQKSLECSIWYEMHRVSFKTYATSNFDSSFEVLKIKLFLYLH